jgi:DNA polymerase family A
VPDDFDRAAILKGAADILERLGIEDSEVGEVSRKAIKRLKRGTLPDRYMKVLDFNPDSTEQVADLAKHFRVKLPRRKDSDDEDALSTEKKYLLKAAKKFPVFRLILECRERNRLLSTYNWRLDEQQRVHTTIGHHPSTWRKSSRDYNLQNIPKRSDLASAFRRMVVAPPGYVITECDSSAIEAVLVGYFARSQRYINLAKAGIHDWFNAVVHGEGFSPDLPFDKLRALCKAAKARYPKESREVSKRTIHLTAYRGTPERMHDEYPDTFPTTAFARKHQNMLLATGPGEDLKAWWDATLKQAAHDRFLQTPFGARHRFFHIYTYDKRRQCYVLGDDAKRAIAFKPQNSASMIQDIFILALWASPLEPWMRLPIHDSTLAVVPIERAQEAARAMHAIFTAPIPELDGLTIGAEIKQSGAGGNWADRTEANPLGMEEVTLC